MAALFTRCFPWFLLLTVLLAGCATPMRKLQPSDLPRLPKSTGFYGGSIYPVTPWIYEGSTARYHHFRYTYTRDNFIHSLRILIAKADMSLAFEKPMDAIPERGIQVELAWDESTFSYTFLKPVTPDPKDAPWQSFPDKIPRFNQTLDPLP
jgi:hypothetical protein